MKINNETKIGVMAVMGIILLALGFNFLKGNNLFKKTSIYMLNTRMCRDFLNLTRL